MPDDEHLLDRAAAELTRAVEALSVCRAEHRRVEALLVGVLEHVPVCLAVVDPVSGVVVAASAAAEQQWRAVVDGVLADGVRASASTASAELEDGSLLLWSVNVLE